MFLKETSSELEYIPKLPQKLYILALIWVLNIPLLTIFLPV